MPKEASIDVLCLGQSGFRLHFPGASVVYIDPYLSDNVAVVEGPEMRRQFPVVLEPGNIADANWILMSHGHLDHCDLETAVPLSNSSPTATFLAPNSLRPALAQAGIAPHRFVAAAERWLELGERLRVCSVPAAHPSVERDAEQCLRCIGFVLEYQGRRVYHAGDTSLDDAVVEALKALMPIDVAFLPVNERNYYRERRGIVGNMTLREAFQFAADLGVRTLVPMHWDMFAPNSVYPEEIELLYRLMKPSFRMDLRPQRI